MLLLYIRHGNPIYDPDGLTPLGERQAEALAKRLAVFGVDRIFASTSNRAIQTAKPISEMLKKEIMLLDFCHENYAAEEFFVLTKNGEHKWAFLDADTKELFADKRISLNEKWYEDSRFSGNKFQAGIERINKNVEEWLFGLGYRHDREKGIYEAINPTKAHIALFAHGGFGQAFLSSVLDIPYPMFCTRFEYLQHSAITAIEFSEENGAVIPKVLTHSNDGHLYSEGIAITK